MYYNNQMPPWLWPPMGPTTTTPADPAATITQWIQSLETLKKAFKEEKKDDKPKDKKPEVSVIGMMLFMILMSPITGPIVYWFYQQSNAILHR